MGLAAVQAGLAFVLLYLGGESLLKGAAGMLWLLWQWYRCCHRPATVHTGVMHRAQRPDSG